MKKLNFWISFYKTCLFLYIAEKLENLSYKLEEISRELDYKANKISIKRHQKNIDNYLNSI